MTGPVDPLPSDVVLCTYPDTLDGCLAAWVVRKMARDNNVPVEFQFEYVPITGLEGRNWIEIKEASVARSPGDEESLWLKYKSCAAFLRTESPSDRHQPPLPFSQWERTPPFGIRTMSPPEASGGYSCVHSPNKSLSSSVWSFFSGGAELPALFAAVDRDVRGDAFPDDAAIVACLQTYPRDFVTLDRLVEAAEDLRRREFMIVSGQAVLRYIARNEAS